MTKKLDTPFNITTTDVFPITANYIYDNITPGNSEDVMWANLIDSTSDIVQYEIGASLTQSYQYTKLHDEVIILTKWQGMHTINGPEFRIGLGDGKVGSKQTPPIMTGNFKTGVKVYAPLSIGSVKLGTINGDLCIEKEGKWYAVQMGDERVQAT